MHSKCFPSLRLLLSSWVDFILRSLTESMLLLYLVLCQFLAAGALVSFDRKHSSSDLLPSSAQTDGRGSV